VSGFHRATSYLKYWLNAVNEHSLQAPFIYDLYKKVVKKKVENGIYKEIEAVRQRLIRSEHTVPIIDYGAGSSVNNGKKRPVAQIAKYGITKEKYGKLLHRLVEYTESKNILELGTSLGLSTLYLSANAETKVTSLEGSESLVNIAESVFEAQERANITVKTGNIDELLPDFILESEPLDFVYFDANHTKEATLSYFSQCLKKSHDQSCFVFDDIHWSKPMEEAWNAIKNNFNVTLSIDVYQMGIVFFNPEIRKQHYILEI